MKGYIQYEYEYDCPRRADMGEKGMYTKYWMCIRQQINLFMMIII